ncbi:hypothetical protein B0I35DRAFT_434037 [Stachybotrys elegans]|uniref:Zn(2)-C6 fungal-type domain-containing protein n=1 Tax=Stachybotrys elegans TaxID=80388 RepID=A0A8K0SMI4_9HYPO|nr:hypothetical protein B0I35DRAFT_434037 [Stachybotrys elegans]
MLMLMIGFFCLGISGHFSLLISSPPLFYFGRNHIRIVQAALDSRHPLGTHWLAMVYLGPSRGCMSCKKRRKKCDETRPSCLRCIKSKRTCGGYEASSLDAFRQHDIGDDGASTLKSIARKCSLPRNPPAPEHGYLTADALPHGITQDESNMFGLRAFLYDFCILPSHDNMSRGFLSTLEVTVRQLGPKSDLARACQAVSFLCGGKMQNRKMFIDKAERFYQELLGSVAKAIDSPVLARAPEVKLMVILLGMHQMVTADEDNHANYDIHSRGLAALWNIRHTPFDLLRGSVSGRFGKRVGVFSIPGVGHKHELDDLILDLSSLGDRFETYSSTEDLPRLQMDATALDDVFQRWEESRDPAFKPTLAGNVPTGEDVGAADVGLWPGRVDTYTDLYIAGVWNIFRMARLVLLSIISSISHMLDGSSLDTGKALTANRLAEEMIASIPYHLVENLPVFVGRLNTSAGLTETGKFIGGLLLIHPLYVTMNLEVVAKSQRRYLRSCLAWIGSSMPFGQAARLSRMDRIERRCLESDYMVLLSGFLL